MRTVSLAWTVTLMSAVAVAPSSGYAEEPVLDKFKIALGGYALARYTSTLSVTDPTLGVGASISPADTLGVETEQAVVRLDGYYRFNPRHSLTYSWYRVVSDGNKTVDEEFDWVDGDGNAITIPVGAQVDTRLAYDIFKVGYLWSFYHSEKAEISFGGGLHTTRLQVDLEAETTGSPIDTQDVDATLPMPVISFRLAYHVTPKFHWVFLSEAFALSFDEWSGSYTDNTIALEYRAWRNVGVGLGFGSNSLEVNRDSDDYNIRYNNRVAGGLLYVAGYF